MRETDFQYERACREISGLQDQGENAGIKDRGSMSRKQEKRIPLQFSLTATVRKKRRDLGRKEEALTDIPT